MCIEGELLFLSQHLSSQLINPYKERTVLKRHCSLGSGVQCVIPLTPTLCLPGETVQSECLLSSRATFCLLRGKIVPVCGGHSEELEQCINVAGFLSV